MQSYWLQADPLADARVASTRGALFCPVQHAGSRRLRGRTDQAETAMHSGKANGDALEACLHKGFGGSGQRGCTRHIAFVRKGPHDARQQQVRPRPHHVDLEPHRMLQTRVLLALGAVLVRVLEDVLPQETAGLSHMCKLSTVWGILM